MNERIYVIKRDDSKQPWDFNKIKVAVQNAFDSVDDDTGERFIEQIELEFNKYLNKGEDLKVEDIQDIIQKFLIKKNKYDVVESFILYRKKRDEIRQDKSQLIKDIAKALAASDVQNQNANLDEYSFGGRLGEAASAASKDRGLKKMSKMARKNHDGNMIYTHDLDTWAIGEHNCLTLPYDYLSNKDVHTRQVDIRAAGSFNTAAQLLAVYFQIQSLQQFGGISAGHVDWSMVPHIRKSFMKHYICEWIKRNCEDFYDLDILSMSFEEIFDWRKRQVERFFVITGLDKSDFTFESKTLDKMYRQTALFDTSKEVYQGCEGLYHNLNSLQSRSGCQLPFSSINFGTCTLPEGRMLIKALLEVSICGLGPKHQTSIFPCQIYQVKEGINKHPGDPNYDLYYLAAKSTGVRLYPNYANCDWSNQKSAKEYDVKVKEDYITNMSSEDYGKLYKLINNCKDDTFERLGLYTEGSKILVSTETRPEEEFSTMGCRTANGADINFIHSLDKNIKSILNGGGIIDNITSACIKDGRGNICPATIILPTLAMQTLEKMFKGQYETYEELIEIAHQHTDDVKTEFIKYLDKKIHECKDMLIERYNHICSQSPKSAEFMYTNGTMFGYHPEEGIQSALRHGTLAVGQLAVAETLQILIGCDQTEANGLSFAHEIEQLFSDRCNEFKKEYKLNFGVYYTPRIMWAA